ncbi:hypothetical protein [Synechococcus phage MA01]
MSEHFEQLRKEKELIKMREALISDWRSDLMEEEEHPYVDVMPSADQKEKDAKKPKEEKKKKKEEKPEKEEVKEGFFSSVNKKKQAAARERLKRHRNGEDVYFKERERFGADMKRLGAEAEKVVRKEEVEELDEKWTDFFTGDSDAKRARRGEGQYGRQGISRSKYNPKTGTTQTPSGGSRGGQDYVFARQNGKAGWKNTKTGDWHASGTGKDGKNFAITNAAAARHDAITKERNNKPTGRYSEVQAEIDRIKEREGTKLTNDARRALGKPPVESEKTMKPVKPQGTSTTTRPSSSSTTTTRPSSSSTTTTRPSSSSSSTARPSSSTASTASAPKPTSV